MASTLNRVLMDMRKFQTSKGVSRKPEDYPDVEIKFMEAHVIKRMRSVIFRTQVQSMSGAGRYAPHVQFYRVELFEEDARGRVPVQDVKTNTVYYIEPRSFGSNVALKCTCSDFRHTWETELSKRGALLGRPRRYIRKTTTYPERNPKHAMGVCKHVYSVVRQLATIGVIK